MTRFALVVLVGMLASTAAQAEPLPWSYLIRLQAADGKERILLSAETPPSVNDDAAPVYFSYKTGSGASRSSLNTPLGSERLFTFSYGMWEESETAPDPETTSINKFSLMYEFNSGGEVVSGSVDGSVSAMGMFTSGTGNFSVSVGGSHEINLGGRRALVSFSGENTENLSAVVMTVEEMSVTTVQTPEPATLILGGIGLAAIAARRLRRGRAELSTAR